MINSAQSNEIGIISQKTSILMKMKESKMYWKLKQQLFRDMKQRQADAMISVTKIKQHSLQTGVEEQLKQLILNCASKSVRNDPIKSDPLDFINQARYKWTDLLLKNYDYTAEKLKSGKQTGSTAGTGSSTNVGEGGDQSELIYIYDEQNFLNFLIGIRNPSAVSLNMSRNTLMKGSLIVPSLNDLRAKYEFLLSPDNVEYKTSNEYKFREKRAKNLAENEALESDIETLAQGGFTSGERVELYMKYFGIESSSYKHFAKLEEEVDKKELLFDEILLMDSEVVADSDQYFIFQEIVERITQAFLRDKEVKDKLKIFPLATDKLNQQDLQKIPPCFVIPMKFLSMLVAPLGFCSNKVDITYMIFKEFYCNFFCYLHSISSQPNGIMFVSSLFEELMSSVCYKVMSHLDSLNVEPLKIAFPWIFFCFFGYTSVENIFYLLDRIIGYRSLDILAIFAVGVFKLNQNEILKCRSTPELDLIFSPQIDHSFLNCVKAVIG